MARPTTTHRAIPAPTRTPALPAPTRTPPVRGPAGFAPILLTVVTVIVAAALAGCGDPDPASTGPGDSDPRGTEDAHHGTLVATVVDADSALVAGACLTIAPLDPDGSELPELPRCTDAAGEYTEQRLVPGRYALAATFTDEDVARESDTVETRVAAGEVATITLTLQP